MKKSFFILLCVFSLLTCNFTHSKAEAGGYGGGGFNPALLMMLAVPAGLLVSTLASSATSVAGTGLITGGVITAGLASATAVISLTGTVAVVTVGGASASMATITVPPLLMSAIVYFVGVGGGLSVTVSPVIGFVLTVAGMQNLRDAIKDANNHGMGLVDYYKFLLKVKKIKLKTQLKRQKQQLNDKLKRKAGITEFESSSMTSTAAALSKQLSKESSKESSMGQGEF